MRGTVIEIGNKIRIIGSNLYLGKWLTVGTEGKIVGGIISLDQYLYRVEIHGAVFSLAPSEFEVIRAKSETQRAFVDPRVEKRTKTVR